LAREPRQPPVEAQQNRVADPGAGRRALYADARASRHMIELALRRDRLARRFGHQHRERRRNRIAVAERDQKTAHSAIVDCWKTVLDVEAQHHRLADMPSRIAGNRAAAHEAMRVLAFWQLVHEEPIELAEHVLETALRGMDQPLAARPLRDRKSDVMRH